MLSTDIYLHFSGNCKEAFTFYKSIFGGDFLSEQRYKDVPGGEKMSPEDQEKIIHIALKISPHTTLMATDSPSNDKNSLHPGNNFHICLQAEDKKEADKLFLLLSKNGKIEMPMNKTFWGGYFGMCQDKFGIFWMISFTNQQTSNI
jgi:PhnB protein